MNWSGTGVAVSSSLQRSLIPGINLCKSADTLLIVLLDVFSIVWSGDCHLQVIEPIQSRCAIVRFTKVSDVDILARLQIVIAKEGITAAKEGLEAIIFTADGDMRQALNNLQVWPLVESRQ